MDQGLLASRLLIATVVVGIIAVVAYAAFANPSDAAMPMNVYI